MMRQFIVNSLLNDLFSNWTHMDEWSSSWLTICKNKGISIYWLKSLFSNYLNKEKMFVAVEYQCLFRYGVS